MYDDAVIPYQVTTEKNGRTIFSGIMRLASPAEYETIFRPIKEQIELSDKHYTLDIRNLKYLNSSGINAFARLVLAARSKKKRLVVDVSKEIPWQDKSIGSLTKLWQEMEVRYH